MLLLRSGYYMLFGWYAEDTCPTTTSIPAHNPAPATPPPPPRDPHHDPATFKLSLPSDAPIPSSTGPTLTPLDPTQTFAAVNRPTGASL